jgi:hypothetical protein
VGCRQSVTLAFGVEQAQRVRANQRRLLFAPATALDRLEKTGDLAGDSWIARTGPVHQLAHTSLADSHLTRRGSARETVQVTERGRLALAWGQAPAQTLEDLPQPLAVVQGAGHVWGE